MTSLSVTTTPNAPPLAGGSLSLQAGVSLLSAIDQGAAPDLLKSLARIPDWQGGPWALRWFACSEGLHMALAESAQGQAVVLVGCGQSTTTSEQFWQQSLQFDAQQLTYVPWPYGKLPSTARVLRSALDRVRALAELEDGRLRLVSALRSLNSELPVVVLGHGHAGALAGVLAPWLESQAPSRARRQMSVISFGAPSVGNAAFTDGLEAHYGAAEGRVFNRLDPVPYLWGGLNWLIFSYVGAAKAPPWLVDRGRRLLGRLLDSEIHCRQPLGGVALQGTLAGSQDWLLEAELQHALSTYDQLLQRRYWRTLAIN